MSQRVTLCILSAAGESGLTDCLASAAGSVDEVLIGLTGSAREAGALAVELGVRVVPVHWRRDFAAARNALLDAVDDGWVLVLDADEQLVLPEGLSLADLTGTDGADGYWLPIVSPTGAWLGGETLTTYQIRLFRVSCRYTGSLGEQVQCDGAIAPDGLLIRHLGYTENEAGRRAERNLQAAQAEGPARGLQLIRLGRAAEALEAFAAVKPVDARWFHWRARAMLAAGRAGEACGVLEQGCGEHPAHTDLWLLWARALAASGRRGEAEAACRRCLDLGTAPPPYESAGRVGDVLPRQLLGALAEAGGRHGEAVGHYSAAYRADPGLPDPLYRLVGALGTVGRAKEAPAILRELVKPRSGDDWLLLADVFSVHRQYGAALTCIRTALRLGAAPAEAGLLQGFCLLQSGKPLEAEAVLAGLDSADSHVPLLRLLAAWCRRDGVTARRIVEEGTLPDGIRLVAEAVHGLLCRTDEQPGAAGAWGRAGGEFLLQVVDALLAARRREDAGTVAGLMDCTDWPGGHRALAVLLRLRGQHQLALRFFRQAVAVGPADSSLLCGLAELELRARNWPRALELTVEAGRLNPDDPVPYLLRARILRAQAVDLLRIAVRRGDDPEAAALLAEFAAADAAP